MVDFSRMYCTGGLGGFMGADGINPLKALILVGDAHRQWLEPRYFDRRLKPLGDIKTIIPDGPNHPNMMIDACITFFPSYFRKCPSMVNVRKKTEGMTRLDFNLGKDKIPDEWSNLHKEALPIFKKLNLFEANLIPLELNNYEIK